MRTAFGYVRVSSEEQADSGLGLEAQRQRVRAYCEMQGLDLENIFEDPGVSGGKPLAPGPRAAGSWPSPDAAVPWLSSPGSTVSSAPWPTPPRRLHSSTGWGSSW